MNHKIKSLNDLSIALHEMNKKYKISDFIEEYKTAVGNSSFNIIQELNQNDTSNPFQKLINLSSKLSDDDIEKVASSTETITEKYNYEEYLEECSGLREAFLKDRKSYFASKVAVGGKTKSGVQNIFDLSGAADVVLGDFIDKALNKISPSHIDIVYEDLNGKKIFETSVNNQSFVQIDPPTISGIYFLKLIYLDSFSKELIVVKKLIVE